MSSGGSRSGRSQIALDSLVTRNPQVESAGVFVARRAGCRARMTLPPWVAEQILTSCVG